MLDEQVIDAVATGNLKAISEQPAMLSNLAYSNVVSTNNLGQQNAVSNQQSGNQLGVSLLAKATNTVGNFDPMAARSAVDVLSNNELAQTIADLKATVEAFAGPGGHRKLKLWKDLDVSVDENGRLESIFIKGKFRSEDIKVEADGEGISIDVKTTG